MGGVELASGVPTQSARAGQNREKRAGLPVCVLDHESSLVLSAVALLEHLGFPAKGMTEPREALAAVRNRRCRALLTDVRIPGMNGLDFLDQALRLDPGVEILLMTTAYSVEAALEAIRRGARDYLTKPLEAARLEKTLDEIADHHSRRRRVQALEAKLLAETSQCGIVGQSPPLVEMIELMKKVAPHCKYVLVTGPAGAGKELVARALDQMSSAENAGFAAFNCSMLEELLLESHLFGKVRGPLAGAKDAQNGLVKFSDGGTVFLKEVGELSPALQAKLMRAIENRDAQRAGSPGPDREEVRLVAATTRNLRTEVTARRFREDLYRRLSMMEIRVPALAERAGDIPLLANYFLKNFNQAYGRSLEGFTRRAMCGLTRHRWPGNVRELENAVSSACITAAADVIDLEDLPPAVRRTDARSQMDAGWRPVTLDQVRQDHIERVLESCNGNRLRAAQLLGIGRTSLYRFLKRRAAG